MKMAKQCTCALLVWLSISMLLTGCWDRTEINDVAFVLASAIDLDKEGIRMSVLIPLPGNMGAGSGGGGGTEGGSKSFTIKTETGTSVREANDKLQRRLPRRLFYGHRRVILIGESLAKQNVSLMLDSVTRMPENRLTALVAVAKGTALDVLNADTRLERFSAESIRELLQSESSIRVSVKDVTGEIMAIGSDAFIPYLEKVKTRIKGQESEDIQISGFALTHDGRMLTTAKAGAATGIKLLSRQFRPYRQSIKVGNSYVSIVVNQAKVQIKPILKGTDEPRFHIRADVKASINEDANMERNYDDIGQRHDIEEAIEQQIVADMKQALAAMQQNNCDVIGFGQYVYRAYPDRWKDKWEREWEQAFSKAQFEYKASVNLYRVGMNNENLAKKGE